MLAQVNVVIQPQNPTLYSKVLQDHITCEDSHSKVLVEDAYLGPQNSQTLHLRLVKVNATCGISNDYQQGGPYLNVSTPPEHISSLRREYENFSRCIQTLNFQCSQYYEIIGKLLPS